jgi:uncharacterized phage-associated protein
MNLAIEKSKAADHGPGSISPTTVEDARRVVSAFGTLSAKALQAFGKELAPWYRTTGRRVQKPWWRHERW